MENCEICGKESAFNFKTAGDAEHFTCREHFNDFAPPKRIILHTAAKRRNLKDFLAKLKED